ncbi:MAG: 4Fe-4S binding protein [Firmicutes bacterium]|nr:4Fe-4S binding protein [Bacillota bacterium]
MDYRSLGATGIRVSRLCLGALTISPLQRDMPVNEGARVITRALELGVNFIDTSQFYRVYPPIAQALEWYSGRDDVVIATKSYAYEASGMRLALEEALRDLNRDHIDIFMLHEQESMLTIKGHWEAVEYLLKAKERGLVRAVGISTHTVRGVRAAALVPELDVISPLINYAGIGIADGNRDDMVAAIDFAAACGKGIYAMKPFGGGHLMDRIDDALAFLLDMDNLASIAVGMKSRAEVEMNVRLFSGQPVPESLRAAARVMPRRLHIDDWCIGCGTCVAKCPSQAMELKNGRAVVDPSRCVFCGYCGAHCPEFAVKVI